MSAADLAAVVRLERECGLSTRGESRYAEVSQGPAAVLLVAEAGGQVVGVFSGWLVAGEFEIDNLAVAAGWRRRGVGGRLLAAGLAEAYGRGAARAVLEVRSGNLAARRLYGRHGFGEAGRRPGYYRDPDDDALILARGR